MTAWLGSVTVPAISPEMSDCAKAAGAKRLATSSDVINVFRKLILILNSPGQRKFGANYSIEKLVLRINPAEADKTRTCHR
jgi:hypothetical protein